MAKAPHSPPDPGLPGSALGAIGRRMGREWRAGPVHRLVIAGPRPRGLATTPRDPRPADPARGAQVLAGSFRFAGEGLEAGAGGDPWRRPAPSRRFAARLHGFDWMGDLVSTGESGVREALRLWLEWRRVFGSFNTFAWSGEALERRVFALACAAPALLPLASEAEGAALLDGLARQARHLLADRDDEGRAAERAAVAALAGAALAGKAGDGLIERALRQLDRRLPEAVLRDGVHASRSPERGMELLFDLIGLDDALSQRGAPAPAAVARAIDRLSAAVRFFTLGDGRLAAFNGGEAGARPRVAAALALEASAGPPGKSAPYGGYHRLEGGGLQLIADAGSPADGPWRDVACVQPAAIAVVCEGRRLMEGCAWSAKAGAGGALRGPAGGSCLSLGEAWPAVIEATAERQDGAETTWLDLAHDGWRRAFGLGSTRRLYLDAAVGELRGEDALTPVGRARRGEAPFEIRFQLAPDVAAQVAADGKSALLRLAGGPGWRLRSDARAMRLDISATHDDGAARASEALALAGAIDLARGGRVRWKLSRDEA